MAVIDASILQESRDRYLSYALSVVTGRALPDVRDGLKPVQRRILFTMYRDLRLLPREGHRKSAAVVGKVIGSYHPHGDSACYEAMVRMAQDFSLRYPLVDGQGNFGSLDGDSAAAYRYTETKLRELALEVIGEIDQETVDFRDNFDATEREPVVFPSRLPNLLLNGASGIAVGMATSIPPHNLKDTVKAALELLEDREATHAKLASAIRGPDFPTGCSILNTRKELSDIYKTGRGMIRMRGAWTTEETARGKRYIVVTSIPYAVNKALLVEKIATLIIEKKLPQLHDVRDESTTEVRVVLELAPGADAEVAMAYLFKNTALESNFPVNFTALVPGPSGALRPELISLRDCLSHFLDFREQVVTRRLQYERRELAARIHILEGLIAIFDALDEALRIIRKSEGRGDAAKKLQVRFKLSEIQSFAVVDMRVYQLSRTNIEEIRAELEEKEKRVKEIDAILASKKRIEQIIKRELEELAEKYGDKRLCKLETDPIEIEFKAEDYVVHEDVFAIVTADGWLKRIRQGNELSTTRVREGDAIARAHALSTHDSVVFFTNLGNIYSLEVSAFPSSSGYGDPVQKLLKFKDGERIVESFGFLGEASKANTYEHTVKNTSLILLVSKLGVGFALQLEGLEGLKRSGKRAMKVRDGDELAAVSPFQPSEMKFVSLFTASGSGLKIESKEIPTRDSAAVGVSLMGVRDGDRIVAALGHSKKLLFQVTTISGRTKELSSDEVVAGHRALKGNKIGVRDEVRKVEVLKE